MKANKKFKTTLAASVMAAASLAFAGVASAATYEYFGTGRLISIGDLELNFSNDANDGFYDIDFVYGSVSDYYGDPPVFDVAVEEAVFILPQINFAMNNDAPELVVQVGEKGDDTYYIPFLNLVSPPLEFTLAAGGEFLGSWDRCETDCMSGVSALGGSQYTFARVSPVGGPPVPVPAAVWLFGSGLLGLVGIARRRRG